MAWPQWESQAHKLLSTEWYLSEWGGKAWACGGRGGANVSLHPQKASEDSKCQVVSTRRCPVTAAHLKPREWGLFD